MRLAAAIMLIGALLGALAVGPVSAQADGDDRIHLIHGLPDTDLDVEIDGRLVVEGFAFRDTHDLSSLAGTTVPSLRFLGAGTDEVVLDAGELTLPDSGSVSALIHLKPDGSLNLSIFENDVSQLAAGESRLIIRHLAAAPAVDVVAAGEIVFEALANGEQREADLAAGSVTASLVPTGEDGPVVIGPADLPLSEGTLLIVYGLGSLEENTMTVLTEIISGLDSPPTAVNTGNSPIGEGSPGLAATALGSMAAIVGLVLFARRRRWSAIR